VRPGRCDRRVAPHHHGLPLAELDRVVDALTTDVRCVPLIGVAAARTQAYAAAATLASEERIAELADTLAARPAAQVGPEAAQQAVESVEAQLGDRTTPGQRRAARGLLTSRAGLQLVVGVAGSRTRGHQAEQTRRPPTHDIDIGL